MNGTDCRDTEFDSGMAAPVDLGKFVLGAGKADFEALDFAQPAFVFGFGYAGEQVVAYLGDAGPLRGIWPVHAASQAALTEMILK